MFVAKSRGKSHETLVSLFLAGISSSKGTHYLSLPELPRMSRMDVKYNSKRDRYFPTETPLRFHDKHRYLDYVFDKFNEATRGRENHRPEVWLFLKPSDSMDRPKPMIAIDAGHWRTTPVSPKALENVAFCFYPEGDQVRAMLPTAFWSPPPAQIFRLGQSAITLGEMRDKYTDPESRYWTRVGGPRDPRRESASFARILLKEMGLGVVELENLEKPSFIKRGPVL